MSKPDIASVHATRWPLWCQMVVPFSLVMLVVMVAVSCVTAYLAIKRTEGEIEGRLRDVAKTVAHATYPLTDSVLAQMRGFTGAQFILTDAMGNRLASSGEVPANLPQASLETADWRELSLGPLPRKGSNSFFHAALDLNRSLEANGPQALHILYPNVSRLAARREAALPPLVLGACGLVMMVVLASGLARRLSQPIQNLRLHAAQIAQGEFRSLPVPSRNDEVRDLILSVNTMAERLDELHLATCRAERMAIMGQLSGGLAHHLRNSVTGARTAVQLHQQRCGTTDPESIEVALRQLTLIESHLKRFLTLSRPEEPQRDLCDLSDVVGNVVSLVEPSFRHHRVSLTVVQNDEPKMLDADADQLAQAIMNLVLNARDAVGPKGWVRLELSTHEGGEHVLRVLDSGPGPPSGLGDSLFEPFVTGKPEGVGLGLAVARQIVQGHCGTLRFEFGVEPTCFELRLPSRLSGNREAPDHSPHPLSISTLKATP